MQASAVAVLVQKGRFDPPVALAIAEAIDMTLVNSQFVTVPVLDARIEAIRSEIRRLDDRFVTAEARTDEKLHRVKVELIFWIVGATAGSALLPKLLATVVEIAQR